MQLIDPHTDLRSVCRCVLWKVSYRNVCHQPASAALPVRPPMITPPAVAARVCCWPRGRWIWAQRPPWELASALCCLTAVPLMLPPLLTPHMLALLLPVITIRTSSCWIFRIEITHRECPVLLCQSVLLVGLLRADPALYLSMTLLQQGVGRMGFHIIREV